MSLFIKGMNMPSANRLYKCELDVRPSGTVLKVNNPITGKEEKYVVETISTPHGRLVDAEKLAVKIWTEGHFVTGNDCEIAVDFTQSAPTIIEAEVSE